MMEVPTLPIDETSTMFHATFAAPDLTTFCRLDELDLEAVGQDLSPDCAVVSVPCRSSGSLVPVVRSAGRTARHGNPSSCARTVRSPTHHAGGTGAPLPVHRVRAHLAAGHIEGR